jgi:hypothetical protein
MAMNFVSFEFAAFLAVVYVLFDRWTKIMRQVNG